ncbi:MAG TPA: adenylosuccinate lyase [Clostridiales bacterium]|nr:adenylosuccinate lyase [Clostridiales bacterium]
MPQTKDRYESPFNSRYASDEMQYLMSPDMKFKTWRKLWIALAEAEKELGLQITQEQIDQLKLFQDRINYDIAEQKEREIRHDVMAHIHAYGEQCPDARGIIHAGATSCYVTDNTDVIIIKEALLLIRKKLLGVMEKLSAFADRYRSLPTLGFTHLQPAQLVTVGKRTTLWIQDLLMDLEDLDHVLAGLKLLGNKDATGTQESFLNLFDGDNKKAKAVDRLIAQKMGFTETFPVSGQTYPRKLDSRVLSVLSGIAQSASKFGNDLRILQNMEEMEEPFEESQVGSSAMAYKRNPMRSERICGLARYVMVDALNPAITASTQWLERTLDDSANKRISITEAFLAVDAILAIYINIVSGLKVYPKVIEKHIMARLPFMATVKILMQAVKKGGDRQDLHERIRRHSMDAARKMKEEGGENDLMERIAADPAFPMDLDEIQNILTPANFIGRSALQVEEFLEDQVRPVLEANKDRMMPGNVDLKV